LLVILTPQAMTDPTADGRALAASSLPASGGKPMLASWMGGPEVRRARRS
jgi:acyl-CoA synthetase (NDP forming)